MRTERRLSTLTEAPLGFDFSLEEEGIRASSSEKTKPRFEENVTYWMMEHLAGVEMVPFSYQREKGDGGMTLSSLHYEGPMREHYLQAAQDTTKPLWFRRRCLIEYQVFCLLEQKLSRAKPGDLFVWLSPPPFEEEEAADHGFGKHSFVHVFRLEQSSQKEWVESYALMNYLDREGLAQFFQQVTGEKIKSFSSEHLLSQLGKVRNPGVLSALDVQRILRKIYDDTPPSRKIIPENDFSKTRDEAEVVLSRFSPWIEGIYYLLRFNASHSLIEREFAYLVMETAKAFRGKEPNLPFSEAVNPAQWAWSVVKASKEMRLRPSSPVSFPSELLPMMAGSCGRGFGFGTPGGSPHLVSYQTVEQTFSEDSGEYVVCPVCGLRVKKGGVCPLCQIKVGLREVV